MTYLHSWQSYTEDVRNTATATSIKPSALHLTPYALTMNQEQVKNRIQIAKWHLERVREVLEEAQHHETAYLVTKLEDELESLRKHHNTGV